jgi:hypothetical protein
MPPTDNPLRLQVIDRIVEVLRGIVAGADYFYTPYAVVKRMAHHLDAPGFPYYMVYPDASARAPEYAGQQLYDELMVVTVKCYVDLEGDEAATKLEKCLRDVRKAIMADQVSGGAGSLATLTLAADVDILETDGGLLALEGRGYFDQRFIFRITGQWGQL